MAMVWGMAGRRLPALQVGFFDQGSEILIFSVGVERESALKEKACFSFLLLAACFTAMLGRVWCGLTLVVSCLRVGFSLFMHSRQLTAFVGVFVFSIVVRSLTCLAGYVQSKGESKSSFWQGLKFVNFFPGPEFLVLSSDRTCDFWISSDLDP